jgi:hypothetical protein
LPVATAWSVPVAFYRAAMLAWSFWLVRALLRWLRDGFTAFASGGIVRRPMFRFHLALRWPFLHRDMDAAAPTNEPASTSTGASTSPPTTPAPSTAAPTPSVHMPEAPAGAPTSAAAVSTSFDAAGTGKASDGAPQRDEATTAAPTTESKDPPSS